jgi:hypothetical protein
MREHMRTMRTTYKEPFAKHNKIELRSIWNNKLGTPLGTL